MTEVLTKYQRFYRKHKEKRKEEFKIYYQKNKEYWKKYDRVRDKEKHLEMCRKYREKNKAYFINWRKNNMDRLRVHWVNRRVKTKDLTLKIIQQIYEENIKKYGTLTCIYCLKPTIFSKDCLEHKTPLCRGGTNEKENLAISCTKCNLRKGRKTKDEFRAYLKK